MKSLSISALLLWGCLVAEHALPDALPHGSLLFPGVCGAVFCLRNEMAIALGGIFLLIDWILRPAGIPLMITCVPLLFAAVVAASFRTKSYVRRRPLFGRIPEPLQLPAMAAVMVLLNGLARLSWLEPEALSDQFPTAAQQMLPVLCRVLPISAIIAFCLRVADELGLRRPMVPTIF